MSWLKDYKSSFNFDIMDYLKTFNVITLSFLLILTGCFGMFGDEEGESAEAEDSTTTSALTAQDIADAMILATNSPPKVSVKTFDFTDDDWEDSVLEKSNWLYSGYYVCVDESDMVDEDGNSLGTTLEEQREILAAELDEDQHRHLANLVEAGDCILYFDFLSVDPDGDSMTKGIDTDFDGIIDVPITPNFGVTMVSLDNSTVKQIFNGLVNAPCNQIDVAFIAIDEHGASTAEFMHFIGHESCELDDDDDGLDEFGWNGIDHPGPYSFSGADGAGADEVVVTMDQGGDLGWASAMINVRIGDGEQVTAGNCADDSTAPCYTVSQSDYAWNIGESITITTQGCGNDSNGDAVATCTVYVIIMNGIVGVSYDMTSIAME